MHAFTFKLSGQLLYTKLANPKYGDVPFLSTNSQKGIHLEEKERYEDDYTRVHNSGDASYEMSAKNLEVTEVPDSICA